MFNALLNWFIAVGIFSIGLCFLVHICSKSKYSFKYESTKRKIEIYPNTNGKPQKQN